MSFNDNGIALVVGARFIQGGIEKLSLKVLDLCDGARNRSFLAMHVKDVHENRNHAHFFAGIRAHRLFDLDDAAVDGTDDGIGVLCHLTRRIAKEIEYK